MEFRETFNLYYLDRHDVHMELSLNSRSAGAQFDSYSDASSQGNSGNISINVLNWDMLPVALPCLHIHCTQMKLVDMR